VTKKLQAASAFSPERVRADADADERGSVVLPPQLETTHD
jgi:hypothetical protein